MSTNDVPSKPPAGEHPSAPPPSVRSPSSVSAPTVRPAEEIAEEPTAVAGPTAATEEPPSVLLHSRSTTRGRFAWLRIALPIAGLLVVPFVGLVYAATASFGKAEEDETTEEAGAATADGGKAKKGKGKAKSAKATTKPRTDGAAECCEKLRELGKTAPIDQRATYLSAAQACEAAPDEDRALRVARSNVKTAKHELPAECE